MDRRVVSGLVGLVLVGGSRESLAQSTPARDPSAQPPVGLIPIPSIGDSINNTSTVSRSAPLASPGAPTSPVGSGPAATIPRPPVSTTPVSMTPLEPIHESINNKGPRGSWVASIFRRNRARATAAPPASTAKPRVEVNSARYSPSTPPEVGDLLRSDLSADRPAGRPAPFANQVPETARRQAEPNPSYAPGVGRPAPLAGDLPRSPRPQASVENQPSEPQPRPQAGQTVPTSYRPAESPAPAPVAAPVAPPLDPSPGLLPMPSVEPTPASPPPLDPAPPTVEPPATVPPPPPLDPVPPVVPPGPAVEPPASVEPPAIDPAPGTPPSAPAVEPPSSGPPVLEPPPTAPSAVELPPPGPDPLPAMEPPPAIAPKLEAAPPLVSPGPPPPDVPDPAPASPPSADPELRRASVDESALQFKTKKDPELAYATLRAAAVGDEIITINELSTAVNERLKEILGGQSVGDRERNMIKNQVAASVLNSMIDQSLILQEAKRQLSKKEKALQQFNESIEKVWISEEVPPLCRQHAATNVHELKIKLSQQGKSYEAMKEVFRKKTLANEFLRNEIKSKLSIDMNDQRAYYNEHLADFDRPARMTWREIEVAVARHPSRVAARQKADDVLARLLRDEPFEALARSVSNGPTASKGGVYVDMQPGSYGIPVVNDELDRLPTGQVSRVLEAPSSFHIIRVDSRREKGPLRFDEVQVQIRDLVFKEKFERVFVEYLAKLRSRTLIRTMFDNTASDPELARRNDPAIQRASNANR